MVSLKNIQTEKLRSHKKMYYILAFPKLDVRNNSHLKKSPPTHTHTLGMKHVIISIFIGNLQRQISLTIKDGDEINKS